MAAPATNNVLIPADIPDRTRLENVLRARGLQPLPYRDDEDVESVLAEKSPAAILFGPSPRRVHLVKKLRHVSPDTRLVAIGRREEGEEGDAVLSENSSPEEIAEALHLDPDRREASLRAQLRQLEAETRRQGERIRELESACDRLRRAAQSAQELALHDELTGLFNRRYFLHAAEGELERARRENARFALAMLDIDHFKRCNDTHGHPVGDRLLKELAEALVENLRRMDTVARYGGEEFIVLLPQTRLIPTAVFDPVRLVERLRRRIQDRAFCKDIPCGPVALTLSAGVVEYPRDGQTIHELIQRVDQRLYRAKATGRNCVSAADA